MTSLRHLGSSAHCCGESVSRQLTALFAHIWRAEHARGEYRYRDLVANPVPPLDTAYCALGRRVERHGLVTVAPLDKLAEDPAEKRAWAQTRPLINEVLAADTVLIGAPMYNYSIPATLKAWIDRISFPGALLDPTTGERLLSATRFVVITTGGGAYGPGTPREGFDFHQPYLRAYLGKQGVAVENMYFIAAEMTLAALAPHLARFQPLAERSLSAARAEVTALATGITQSAARAAV